MLDAEGRSSGGGRAPEGPLADVYGPAVYEDLAWFVRRDDGWLRIVPDVDGIVVWCKWKYTGGNWEGHYHMVRSSLAELGGMLALLRRKVMHSDYDCMTKRPSRDAWFDNDRNERGRDT